MSYIFIFDTKLGHPPIPLGDKCSTYEKGQAPLASLLGRRCALFFPITKPSNDSLLLPHTCITKLPFLTPLLLSSRY